MEHKSYKHGDLKAVKVVKSKGDLVRIGTKNKNIIEMSKDGVVWETLKLKNDNPYHKPEWVHRYFTLDNPKDKWIADKEDAERREAEHQKTIDDFNESNRKEVEALIALKEKKISYRAEKRHNSWYMRFYRWCTQNKLAKVRVLKE